MNKFPPILPALLAALEEAFPDKVSQIRPEPGLIEWEVGRARGRQDVLDTLRYHLKKQEESVACAPPE